MKAAFENIFIVQDFETNVCIIYKRSDGIVKVVIKDDVEIDLEASREMFEILKALTTKKKDLLVLVITGKNNTVTKEVREFSGSDEASEPTLAEAIVTSSLPQRLIVNFIIKFHKPKRHMKMFNNEEEALKWLYSYKQQGN